MTLTLFSTSLTVRYMLGRLSSAHLLSSCVCKFYLSCRLIENGAFRPYQLLHLRHCTLKLQKIRHSRVALGAWRSFRRHTPIPIPIPMPTPIPTPLPILVLAAIAMPLPTPKPTKGPTQHVRLSIRVHWNGNSALQRRRGRKCMLDWMSDGRGSNRRSVCRATDGLLLGLQLTVLNTSQCNAPRTASVESSDLSLSGKP